MQIIVLAAAVTVAVSSPAESWRRESPEKYWNLASLEARPDFRESPFADSDWPGMRALLVKGKGPDGEDAEFL